MNENRIKKILRDFPLKKPPGELDQKVEALLAQHVEQMSDAEEERRVFLSWLTGRRMAAGLAVAAAVCLLVILVDFSGFFTETTPPEPTVVHISLSMNEGAVFDRTQAHTRYFQTSKTEIKRINLHTSQSIDDSGGDL